MSSQIPQNHKKHDHSGHSHPNHHSHCGGHGDEHGHGHSHGHHHHPLSSNMATAFFLNLAFTVIEVIGGFLTGSYAILADAVHDLGDTLTIGIAWFLEKKSKQKPDDSYSYGYARFSLLASVITATILLTGSFFIIVNAVPRLFNPSAPETIGVIGLAILGVCVNGYAFLKMSKDAGHSAKMLRLHLFEDAAGWVVVLIGGAVMHFTDWFIIDPVLAILLAGYISFNVFKTLKEVITIFLQRAPTDLGRDKFKSAILGVEGVLDVHDIHCWSLDHETIILTCHVVISDYSDATSAKSRVKNALKAIANVHPTIEIEIGAEVCKQDC